MKWKIILGITLLIFIVGIASAAHNNEIFKAPNNLEPMGHNDFVDKQGHNIMIVNYTTENATNISFCYAYTCYHTFSIQLKDYNDNVKLDKDLDYIISNMKPDFKQSQD